MGLMVGFELGCPLSLRGMIEWKLIHSASEGLFPQLVVISLHRDHHIMPMAPVQHDLIKLLPPLVIDNQGILTFLDAFDQVLTACRDPGGKNWKVLYDIAQRSVARSASRMRQRVVPSSV